MNPRIELISEKKLVGLSVQMSLLTNRTAELWRSFMPRRNEITDTLNTDLISLQLYDKSYFLPFDPGRSFMKWACAEVTDFSDVPDGMATLVVPTGLYAIFLHKGASNDNSTFQYIFTKWLPASAYQLDDRPHFEVLGAKYKNLNPESEEEIYIPVRPR